MYVKNRKKIYSKYYTLLIMHSVGFRVRTFDADMKRR